MLDRKELNPEDDAADAIDNKFENDCNQVPPNLQPRAGTPQSQLAHGDSGQWWKDRKFILELLGFMVLVAYTWFACLQWLQIRYTNQLTARALDGSDKTLQRTLDKMQKQIEATNNLYKEAQEQTKQDTTMAINSGTESAAGTKSAHAAESAANTAVDTLHITERAYITIDDPTIDVQQKLITLPIFNIGHIASGAVEIVVHQAIANVSDVLANVPTSNAVGIWQRHRFQSAIPGKHFSIFVPFAAMRPEDLNTGHQAIYIAGTVTANDGFPNTLPQIGTFCFSTKFLPSLSRVELAPCDAASLLPLLEKIDVYPSNESK